MASFTATQPWSASAFNNTEIYTFRSTTGAYTAMPWTSYAYTINQPVKIFRGPQVKTWNGTAWVLAPAS